MAQIAEDLFLLLIDNASAQPALDGSRREHVLAAATLLDLAHACRVRPAVAGEPVPEGRLVALDAPGPLDPVSARALALLQTKPLRPDAAIKKLGRDSQKLLVTSLTQTGQIRPTARSGKLFGRSQSFPLADRDRVGAARAALMAALFDRTPPAPATAAIITVLHAVDGLGALLSLNDRGWRWVHARAGEIASGSWVDESPTALPEVNLAVTASAVRHALVQLA
ncbi:GOLPH3/VPS74 family protein [Mycolicibacterium austroafricanum]|uniref:GOLPH3/VPS74 family protein n=1 Tax=Mycolicibacterium austroafricanum TaxID=39687 RepID=UPI001CA35040|nr:GPP34 family phosphoprotein [Mycolicibacterium austroafricanum]QZT61792.1 GPP34 family phosphoprotein [Mycolicibacterium austroafricanum]